MPAPNLFTKIAACLLFASAFAGCKNADDTPFPHDSDEYAAAETTSLQFGPPQKIVWNDNPPALRSIPGRFDLDKLPVHRFDSTGFIPFSKQPEQVSVDFTKLPEAPFFYDSLPAIPLHFKTSLLPAPEITKANRPFLKKVNSEIIYDFGNPLSGVFIQGLLQTRDGFIWIGTGKGIYRYDGENLYRYRINGISSNIYDMVEGRDGKIWIATNGDGVFMIDLKNGTSNHLLSKEGLLSNFTTRFAIDSQNRIWTSVLPNSFSLSNTVQGGSVVIIDLEKKLVRFLQHPHGLSSDGPSSIRQDQSGNIWVTAYGTGINIFDLKKNRVQYLDKAHGLSSDGSIELYLDRAGRIWMSDLSGILNVIDPAKGSIIHLGEQQGFKKGFVGRMMEDHLGNMWIGSDLDVKIIDPALREQKTLNTATGLNGPNNNVLLEDDKHRVLIGTVSGLNIVGKSGYPIHRIGNLSISTMMADSHGRFWLGTLDKGIEILDTATGLSKIYNQAHGLSDDLIQNFAEHNGSIILSTQKGGIEIIDTSLKKIERIGPAQGLSTGNVTAIEKDKYNNIWLGGVSNPGVDVLDIKNKKIQHIGTAEGLNDSTIIDIKQDQKGRMWFYSQKNGIGVIDIDARTVRHIDKSSYAPLTGEIQDNLIMIDSKEQVWLSTSNNGLFVINTALDSVTHFTTGQGLLTNQVTSIKEYNGSIYAGTNLGLNILTPPLTGSKKWKMESLGKSDGISKVIGSYNSDLLLQNGQYWWGDEGITIISNLDKQFDDSLAPATCITGFDIFNRGQFFVNDPWNNTNEKDTLWNGSKKNNPYYVNGQATPQISRVNTEGMQWDTLDNLYNLPSNLLLPYNKNYLQFHFAQRHLGTQDTAWYRYIVEGIDNTWSEKTYNNVSENYPNIPPGTYTFKVASLYHGHWSQPESFTFTITPPWWNTIWAWLIYLLIFGGLVWSFIQYRSRWLKEENQRLEQMVTQRTNELSRSLNELKETQTQLVQSEKMASLGELTAGIAHEIQNPLNFVNNFSEVSVELATELKEEINKLAITPADKENIESIANDLVQNQEKINFHGKRADSIVKGMLQHSRNSNGQKEQTNINDLADEYLRLSYHGLRAKDKSFNAQLKTDFDTGLPLVNIAPQDIGRAILNLFTNAFYSVTQKKGLAPAGYEPTVSVTTKRIGDKLEIRVRDNGMGVPQKVLDKIFNPFFTTKPSGQGTGLGLSLSYDIITKGHGGQMKVDTKEGEYAEFIIQLPI